jgi:alpha-beta hydrolase superfamily lysophospholipase
VLIAHGASEYSARYARFAEALNQAGYVVYAPDHRGHGGTAGTLDKAGWAGPDGWNGIVRDLKQLADQIKAENPGLPLFLFGHSMGSFLAQRYIQLWGSDLRGAVLSGSSGIIPGLEDLLPVMAAAEAGDAASQPSAAFGAMFAGFNEPFKPATTGFEWLSRDPAEVQKYFDDPWCGFPFSNQLAGDMMRGLAEVWQPANEAKIPPDLPLLVFSGAQDPVGGQTLAVQELVRRYRENGMANIEVKFYPEGRHEMLNETNRDEVQQDVIAWLDRTIPGQ